MSDRIPILQSTPKMPVCDWKGPWPSKWNGGFQDAFDGYPMDLPTEDIWAEEAYRQGYRAGREFARQLYSEETR